MTIPSLASFILTGLACPSGCSHHFFNHLGCVLKTQVWVQFQSFFPWVLFRCWMYAICFSVAFLSIHTTSCLFLEGFFLFLGRSPNICARILFRSSGEATAFGLRGGTRGQSPLALRSLCNGVVHCNVWQEGFSSHGEYFCQTALHSRMCRLILAILYLNSARRSSS